MASAADADNQRVQLANHLTARQAEDLLDWLEGHGVESRDVLIEADGRMSVRWQA